MTLDLACGNVRSTHKTCTAGPSAGYQPLSRNIKLLQYSPDKQHQLSGICTQALEVIRPFDLAQEEEFYRITNDRCIWDTGGWGSGSDGWRPVFWQDNNSSHQGVEIFTLQGTMEAMDSTDEPDTLYARAISQPTRQGW
jgi:hypothetical protein